ncbi:MAG: hypothetical protein HYT12_03190 [Candidatus Liptonbacteria bacterium]|nr:hypothetical protein [Candidatus Liptonbacteria bacterium]
MNASDPKFFTIVTIIVLVGLFIAVQFVLPEGFYKVDILGSIGRGFGN